MAISFTFGSRVLLLPAPDFTNTTKLDFDRISRKTRGGDLILFRDPSWPKRETLRYSWSFLSQAKVNELIEFIRLTLGQDIQHTDHESRNWLGTIITPSEDVSQPGPSDFRSQFEFEGSLL